MRKLSFMKNSAPVAAIPSIRQWNGNDLFYLKKTIFKIVFFRGKNAKLLEKN